MIAILILNKSKINEKVKKTNKIKIKMIHFFLIHVSKTKLIFELFY